MATVIGPDFVAFHVRDLAKSRNFYTELLGMEIDERFTSPAGVTFRTAPIPFTILAPSSAVDLTAGPVGLGVTVWFQCDDADALSAVLTTRGVPILQGPEDNPFGRRFICQDPDGYRLVVYKAIPLDQVRI